MADDWGVTPRRLNIWIKIDTSVVLVSCKYFGLERPFMQKSIKIVVLTLISISATLFLAQCHFGKLSPVLVGKKIWLNNDEDLMKQEIRKVIPEGSSIAEAKNILQLNGYLCGYRDDSDAAEPLDTTRTSEDADYLLCYLEVSRFLCVQTYKPAVYYTNARVTRVDINLGGWCL